MRSDIAIAILSYNHPEITARAVASALKLVHSNSLDSTQNSVFLIHNGSLPQHREKLLQQFPQVRHLILEQNLGYSGGVNFGLKSIYAQNFKWVFLLTNDCQILKLNPPTHEYRPALIAPTIWRRKVGHVDSYGGSFCPNQALIYHCKSAQQFEQIIQNSNPIFDQTQFAYIPGSAFWIHRDVFVKTHGFDESLGTYWEDVDLSMRAQSAGFKLAVDEMSEVQHQVGKTNHKDLRYTSYYFLRNQSLICLRYAHPKQILKLKFKLLFEFIKKIILSLLRRQWQKALWIWRALKDSRLTKKPDHI